jgi:hypothetical protein
MLDYVAEELSSTPGWRRVLEAYASQTATLAAPTPASQVPGSSESVGWVKRLSRLDGIEPERLPSLHGKLIALGLLSFEISGKAGMQYQLSPLGHRTLSRRAVDRGVEESLIDDAIPAEIDDRESSDA